MAVTYTSLIAETPAAIMATNSSIAAEMPRIISRAVATIQSRINPELFKKSMGPTFINYGTRLLDLSADLTIMGPRELYISYGRVRRPIFRRGRDYCRALFPDDRAKAIPRFYAEAETRVLEFYPFPKDGTLWEGMFDTKAMELGPGQDSNLFTDEVPLLLEHCTRMFAATFMKDTMWAQTYSALFEAELAAQNDRIARRRRDEVTARPKQTDNVAGNGPGATT